MDRPEGIGLPGARGIKSPVWLAVALALEIRMNTTPEGGTDSTQSRASRADVGHGGELRRLLAYVAESLEAAEGRPELHGLLRPLVRQSPLLALRHSSGNDTFHHWRTRRFLGNHVTRFYANHVAPQVKNAENPPPYFRRPRVTGTQ